MKKFTKLATLSMALLLALGMSVLTACGDKNDSSENNSSVSASSEDTKTYTCYEFTVKKADGTNADGYHVQLCTVQEDGTLGTHALIVVKMEGEYSNVILTK